MVLPVAGPGRGITMQDGTLVFPIQFIDATRVPNAGVMYSKDRGQTWHLHNLARTNTTEAQVVEVEPGVLMLNMRDNRGGSRAVAVTKRPGQDLDRASFKPQCLAGTGLYGKPHQSGCGRQHHRKETVIVLQSEHHERAQPYHD